MDIDSPPDVTATKNSKDSVAPASHLFQEEVFKNSANFIIPSIIITPPESNNRPPSSTTDKDTEVEVLGDHDYFQDTTQFIPFSPISFSAVIDFDQSRPDSYDFQQSAVEFNQIFSTLEENSNTDQNASETSKSSIELVRIGDDVPKSYKQQLAPTCPEISASESLKDGTDSANHLLQEEVFKTSANFVIPSITITPPDNYQDTTQFIPFSPISFPGVLDLDQSQSYPHDLQDRAVELEQIFRTVEGIFPEKQNPPETNQNTPGQKNPPVKSKSSIELLRFGDDVPKTYKQQPAPTEMCTGSFRTDNINETDSNGTVHQEIKELHIEIIQIPETEKIPTRGTKPSRSRCKSKAKSSLSRKEGGGNIKLHPYLGNGGGSSRSLLKTKSGVQSSHRQSSENKSVFSQERDEKSDTHTEIVGEIGNNHRKVKSSESTNKAQVLFINTSRNDTENSEALASETTENKTNTSSGCQLSAHCQSLETESAISVDENRLSDSDRDFLDTLSKHS